MWLEPAPFFEQKWAVDCARCAECGLGTARCQAACGDGEPVELAAFPEGCAPIEHDAHVCLAALRVASCDEYRGYVADAPSAPTECDFCPTSERP